jgi:AAA+ ATPase superfamily predicted ATPase
MVIQFIDRVNELGALSAIASSDAAALVVVYGKRRVGKTELLNRIPCVLYYVARQESSFLQLRSLSFAVADFFDDVVLRSNPFQNFDSFFLYLRDKSCSLVLDEFPYLVDGNASLPSILQTHWDQYLKDSCVKIILCGSSVAMMESLLGYKSPLYGRRTHQFLISPIPFPLTQGFFPKQSLLEHFETYAVLGGTPAYLLQFKYDAILENVRDFILRKDAFLFAEPIFLLKEELREPAVYYTILKGLAKGASKLSDLVDFTGVERTKIVRYLETLQLLKLVKREIPITDNPLKSRKGLYVISDYYFLFWFRFVFPYMEYIEQNKQDVLIRDFIAPSLNQYFGLVFEDVVRARLSVLFGDFIMGRWWDKEVEIDMVGLNKMNNCLLLGEVKYKDLSVHDAKKVIFDLKAKSSFVKWGKSPSLEFVLVAKSIASKEKIEQDCGVRCFSFEDLFGEKS